MLSALAIGTPPSSHFIYIPVIFVLGITLGFIFGSKAARDAIAFEQKKRWSARSAARNAKRRRPATTSRSDPLQGPGLITRFRYMMKPSAV